VLEQEHWHLAANLLFREAAVLLQKVIANEPTNTKALYALANVLERQGKLTDAEAATSKALAIQQSALGREHPDFAAGLELLAHLFLSQHKLTEAEPLCRESLATRKKLGLAPELAAQSANSLATVLIGQGKAFEAETLLRDELSALERKIPENWEIFRARSLLGSSLMEQSKSADAEPWLARGYEGMKLRQRTIPHEYLPELKRAWSGLLSYYLTNGQAGTIKSREIRLELMHSRGEQFARHARWQEAIAEFSKAVELAPDEHDAYHALSPMLVQVGDLDGYKRHRSAVLDRFGGTTDPLVAERMAKDCLILPSSEAELTRISKLADSAVARGPNHWALPFFQFAKGLAEYRQGQFSSAAELMQKVLATRGIPFREAQAQLVLAMANNQLQKHEAARAALLKGVEIVETKLPRLESSDLGDGWNDVLIAHALLREARALIEGNRTGPRLLLSQISSSSNSRRIFS
jgi:tetratricopeptide (TPR) repeat protein